MENAKEDISSMSATDLLVADSMRELFELADKPQITNCSYDTGVKIDCPEGTYKYIGSNNLNKYIDNGRSATKEVDRDVKEDTAVKVLQK